MKRTTKTQTIAGQTYTVGCYTFSAKELRAIDLEVQADLVAARARAAFVARAKRTR